MLYSGGKQKVRNTHIQNNVSLLTINISANSYQIQMYKYLKSEIKAKRKYKLMNKSWLYIYLHMCTYFTTMYKKHSALYVYNCPIIIHYHNIFSKL